MSTATWITAGVAIAAVCCIAMQFMRDVGRSDTFNDIADLAELAFFPLCAALILFPVARMVV